jgi:hypothetical protein
MFFYFETVITGSAITINYTLFIEPNIMEGDTPTTKQARLAGYVTLSASVSLTSDYGTHVPTSQAYNLYSSTN